MIKCIFIDLDGTLLNSEKKISKDTLNSLIKCKNGGIQIFTATARPPLLKNVRLNR